MSVSKIKLDSELLERCRQQARKVGYSCVEEFVSHVLEKELRLNGGGEGQDAEQIKKQLKGLGYLG